MVATYVTVTGDACHLHMMPWLLCRDIHVGQGHTPIESLKVGGVMLLKLPTLFPMVCFASRLEQSLLTWKRVS